MGTPSSAKRIEPFGDLGKVYLMQSIRGLEFNDAITAVKGIGAPSVWPLVHLASY